MRGIKLSKIFVLGSKNDWAAAKKKITFTLFISNGIRFFRFKNAFFGYFLVGYFNLLMLKYQNSAI
jgi:hypothetical protein